MNNESLESKLVCNLGDILKERDVSVNQLAKDINHRRATINDLVNNKDMDIKRIPATLIADLCSYLKITPGELFTVVEGDLELENSYRSTISGDNNIINESSESFNKYNEEQLNTKDELFTKEVHPLSFLTSRTTVKVSIKNELLSILDNLSHELNIPFELLIDEAIELLIKQQK